MYDAAAETGDKSPERRSSSRNWITLGTLLMIIAAIAAECALVVHIKRGYAANPPFATPVCPEEYATPVVLLWIILGSVATYAWRRSSVTRLAAQVAVSCTLVMTRLWAPTGAVSEMLWPVTCFGVFFVTPHLLYRFARTGDSSLVVADSAVVALLTHLFVVHQYVPKM